MMNSDDLFPLKQEKLAQFNTEKWAEENKNVIQAYNEFVDEHGCFGDEFREF